MFTVFIVRKFEHKIPEIKNYLNNEISSNPNMNWMEYEIQIIYSSLEHECNYIDNLDDQYLGVQLLNEINDICDGLDDRYNETEKE